MPTTVNDMASTSEQQTQERVAPLEVFAVIDAEELEEARRDERVREFHRQADAQLAEAEAAGRVLY